MGTPGPSSGVDPSDIDFTERQREYFSVHDPPRHQEGAQPQGPPQGEANAGGGLRCRRGRGNTTSTLLSLALGVGLAAACGFRVFVPLLVAAVAARTGHLGLAPGFSWLASDAALLALGAATLLEVLAYAVPWLDHALDALASPAAVVAGVVASAAVFVDLPPAVRWGAAVILGGGAAGVVQAGTVFARLKSALFTGGVGNIVVAFLELAGAVLLSVLAVLAPVLVLLALALLAWGLMRLARRRKPAADTR